jgi:hypothetical protein
MIVGEVIRRKNKKEEFYSLDDLLGLSKVGEPYMWLCSVLLPRVVGWKIWIKRNTKQRLREVATCSDEAFVLLTVENNYDRWLCEADWMVKNQGMEKEDQAVKNFPDAKYTNSGRSRRNGRSRRLQGWAREGYLRFNALYKAVGIDRSVRAQFEQELLERIQHGDRDQDTNISDIEDDEEEIFPANDLGGVMNLGTGTAEDEESEASDES